jgi:hypothetical protein
MGSIVEDRGVFADPTARETGRNGLTLTFVVFTISPEDALAYLAAKSTRDLEGSTARSQVFQALPCTMG